MNISIEFMDILILAITVSAVNMVFIRFDCWFEDYLALRVTSYLDQENTLNIKLGNDISITFNSLVEYKEWIQKNINAYDKLESEIKSKNNNV